MSAPVPAIPLRRKPDVELIAEDGIPMESDWHRDSMNQLIEVVECAFAGRQDFYVGGNMFIYYSEEQARNRDFRGPDFFFIWDVNHEPRRDFWVGWEEGERYPNVVIELTSPSTAAEDRTTKFEIYERILRTPEYFIYDPATHRAEGWRRRRGRYRALPPNAHGWLWSEELEMWLGNWHGNFHNRAGIYPRFFDSEGTLVPRFDELAENDRRKAAKLAEEAQANAQRQVEIAENARAEATRTARLAEDAKAVAKQQAKFAEEAEAEAKRQVKRAEEAEAEAKRQAKRTEEVEAELQRLRDRNAELEGRLPPK